MKFFKIICNFFSGTGNVLKIQNLLHICSEHYETDKEEDKKDEKSDPLKKAEKKSDKELKDSEKKEEAVVRDGAHQGIAVLGIAAIAMGEDIGIEMAMRAFNHLVSSRFTLSLSLGLNIHYVTIKL